MTKNIKGVNVEIDHPIFKTVKSQEEIKRIGLFDHLSDEDVKEGCKELWEVLHPGKQVTKEAETDK